MANLNIEKFYKSFPTMAHKRNRFPWEKEINWNCKMGEITPICAIRVVPGETFNLDMSTVMKVAPLQVPPMDNAIAKFFAFYGPDRISWRNYPYWFGEKQNPENPEQEPTYVVPKVVAPEGGFTINSFFDNIGCATGVANYKIDAYLSRLDRQIYNYYFRNQTLENPLTVNLGDGNDNAADNMALRKICKPRDLFTQCLPTQSGTTPVEIPLGSYAPVIGTGKALGLTNGTTEFSMQQRYNANYIGLQTNTTTPPPELPNTTAGTIPTTPTTQFIGVSKNSDNSGLIADLTKALGAPLEGLYQAVAANTMQYICSRGGNRYFERVSNIYGTVNPDGVLQMPEFLGSISTPIDFDTITQTSSTAGEATPLANRAANGYMENYGGIINKSFGEFGWILIYGVVTCYPKYQQGTSRLMQTEDPLELFNPIFNLMGDEAIYRNELYQQSDDVVNSNGTPVNDEVFGYGKRNSRLLYPVNEIHGEQRSTYQTTLDANHFAQKFTQAPVLNKTFDKTTDEGFKRALQVTDETQFICNTVITGTNDIEIPLEAVPSIIPLQAGIQH